MLLKSNTILDPQHITLLRMISFFHTYSYIYIRQTVTLSMPSKSVTKLGRPKAMMRVPIVYLLILSCLANWPFYLSGGV